MQTRYIKRVSFQHFVCTKKNRPPKTRRTRLASLSRERESVGARRGTTIICKRGLTNGGCFARFALLRVLQAWVGIQELGRSLNREWRARRPSCGRRDGIFIGLNIGKPPIRNAIAARRNHREGRPRNYSLTTYPGVSRDRKRASAKKRTWPLPGLDQFLIEGHAPGDVNPGHRPFIRFLRNTPSLSPSR